MKRKCKWWMKDPPTTIEVTCARCARKIRVSAEAKRLKLRVLCANCYMLPSEMRI